MQFINTNNYPKLTRIIDFLTPCPPSPLNYFLFYQILSINYAKEIWGK